MFETIEWKNGRVVMLDQTVLPEQEIYNEYASVEEVASAIERLVIRGAPAIGVAAAMGIALGAQSLPEDPEIVEREFEKICDRISRTRPTAVNLFWAVERMKKVFAAHTSEGVHAVREALLNEALKMKDEDIAVNRAMGKHGSAFISDGDTVLTHCNAGALATAGYGTALGVVRAAREQGKRVAVLADETRPFLQGARLTAWELLKDDIPVSVITDGMAGHFLRSGKIDLVVVGADRIAGNGDVANKIGTYGVAVLAKENEIPFYVAAPTSTLDLSLSSGDEIPIEERDPTEVTNIHGHSLTPTGVSALHPAFDITPAKYITAIITEKGIAKPPFKESLARLINS